VRAILLVDSAVRDAVTDYVRVGDVAQLSDPAFRAELVHRGEISKAIS